MCRRGGRAAGSLRHRGRAGAAKDEAASHDADGLSSTSCGDAAAAGARMTAPTASNASAAHPAPSTRCAARDLTPRRVPRAVGRVPDEPAVAHREPPRCAGGELVRRASRRSTVASWLSRARPAGRSRRRRSRVEVAGGLVGEDHARADDERPGDRDALLLAAGEVRREVEARSARPTSSSRPRERHAARPSLRRPARAPPRRSRARSASGSG